MHICVSELAIIGSDNGLSPHRRQAIIWTNDEWQAIIWTHAEILWIGLLKNKFLWNFDQNFYNFILENALENVICEMVSILPGLNVLMPWQYVHQAPLDPWLLSN